MKNFSELTKMGVNQRNILFDIALTVLTFGLYNLYVQLRQIHDYNDIIGTKKRSATLIFIFSILTLGIYFCFHEYSLTKDLYELVEEKDGTNIGLMAGIASFFGLWFLVDSYQQSLLNEYLEILSSQENTQN